MMDNTNVAFANLTDDQLTEVKKFEKEFNSKYGNSFFIMAFGEK